jgi:hypothetical protein
MAIQTAIGHRQVTAYNYGGQNNTASGTGTYNNPVTFGRAGGELNECEIMYIPYLEKYVRYEFSTVLLQELCTT